MCRQKYLYIKYPDGLKYVKAFPDTIVGREELDTLHDFFRDLGCTVAGTFKREYDRFKDALNGKCEQCREGEGNCRNGELKICEICAKRSCDETRWLTERLEAEAALSTPDKEPKS